MRAEVESVVAPAAVGDVGALLGWLGQRKPGAAALFTSERLRATMKRQLAEPLTQLHDGDEIGPIPRTPLAPPTPSRI